MSSSATALGAPRLGYPRHEPGELADLLDPLFGLGLQVIATKPRLLDPAVGFPVAGSLLREGHVREL